MGIQIRKALASDLDAVAAIYDRVHDAQDSGQLTTGWIRGVYPTRATAQAALDRGDLFVALLDGAAAGAAILNQVQVDVYAGAPWRYDVPDSDVMVLHTLVIDPAIRGRGLGRAFLAYYEGFALSHGCRSLRIDTNARKATARAFCKKQNGPAPRLSDRMTQCLTNGVRFLWAWAHTALSPSASFLPASPSRRRAGSGSP